jgi:hypothetical protein
LPERCVVVSSQEWKTYVDVFRETIRRSLFDHFIFFGIDDAVMAWLTLFFLFFSLIIKF